MTDIAQHKNTMTEYKINTFTYSRATQLTG